MRVALRKVVVFGLPALLLSLLGCGDRKRPKKLPPSGASGRYGTSSGPSGSRGGYSRGSNARSYSPARTSSSTRSSGTSSRSRKPDPSKDYRHRTVLVKKNADGSSVYRSGIMSTNEANRIHSQRESRKFRQRVVWGTDDPKKVQQSKAKWGQQQKQFQKNWSNFTNNARKGVQASQRSSSQQNKKNANAFRSLFGRKR